MAGTGVQTLCAVGDIMINREHPGTVFELARPLLEPADFTFGNCESTYSERGARNPATRGEVRAHPRNLDALVYGGFDVVSFANNHHLDAGYEAFFDTLAELAARGIATCGAGKDIAEARRPAILERARNARRLPRLLLHPVPGVRSRPQPARLRAAARPHVLRAGRGRTTGIGTGHPHVRQA